MRHAKSAVRLRTSTEAGKLSLRSRVGGDQVLELRRQSIGWAKHYHEQRQAQQLREIERNTAAAAGVEPRKLNWAERNLMGVKDPERTARNVPPPRPQAPEAQVRPDQRVADLEGRVASLEARLQRAFDAIEQLQQEASSGASSQ